MTQIAVSRISLASDTRNIWYVTPEHDTPFEAIIDPKFWAHVSMRFRPRDRIEIDAEDGSYFAELMVLDCGRLWARVEVIRKVTFGEASVGTEVSPEYEVKWAGRHAKWRVVRKADKAPIKDGLEDRAAADQWLLSHLKAVAA